MHREISPLVQPPSCRLMTEHDDNFDLELSLDELKALSGGIKATPKGSGSKQSVSSPSEMNEDGSKGFPDLYGI